MSDLTAHFHLNWPRWSRQRQSKLTITFTLRPKKEHTEIEEELHDKAHIDYDRVAIVCSSLSPSLPHSRSITSSPSKFSHFYSIQDLTMPLTMTTQIANPSVAALYEDALVYETGSAITSSGALSAYSGEKTGRSPSDKRIVEEDSSKNEIWWGPVNKPMKPDVSAINSISAQSSACPAERLAFRRENGS